MNIATLLAAAAATPEQHQAWDTLLWIIALVLFIAGIVWFYRALVATSMRFAAIAVACWVAALLIGPGGVSLFT